MVHWQSIRSINPHLAKCTSMPSARTLCFPEVKLQMSTTWCSSPRHDCPHAPDSRAVLLPNPKENRTRRFVRAKRRPLFISSASIAYACESMFVLTRVVIFVAVIEATMITVSRSCTLWGQEIKLAGRAAKFFNCKSHFRTFDLFGYERSRRAHFYLARRPIPFAKKFLLSSIAYFSCMANGS